MIQQRLIQCLEIQQLKCFTGSVLFKAVMSKSMTLSIFGIFILHSLSRASAVSSC